MTATDKDTRIKPGEAAEFAATALGCGEAGLLFLIGGIVVGGIGAGLVLLLHGLNKKATR